MKLIFITTCKPFDEEYSWKQEQSIKSWVNLEGIEKQIIIVGNDAGVAGLCQKYDLIHHPDIRCLGPVPYIYDMLQVAASYANNDDLIIWTNADMIYTQTLIDTIKAFKNNYTEKDYLLVGQRWDWKTPRIIDTNDNNIIKKIISEECNLHASCGIDYIIHSKTSLLGHFDTNMVIAGTTHDMKMLQVGLNRRIPTVNCTNTILTIHHNHSRPPVDPKRLQNNRNTHGRQAWIHECSISANYNGSEIIFKKLN